MRAAKQTYYFSAVKNKKLIVERGIRFEEIIAAIDEGRVLDIVVRHNEDKYASQKMYIADVGDYVYLVRFIEEDDGKIILKTVIPSRKAKKQYGKGVSDHDKKER